MREEIFIGDKQELRIFMKGQPFNLQICLMPRVCEKFFMQYYSRIRLKKNLIITKTTFLIVNQLTYGKEKKLEKLRYPAQKKQKKILENHLVSHQNF